MVIAGRLGIDRATCDKLFAEYIEFTPPKSEFERILQFHRLVLLMNIDQNIKNEELTFIKNLGIRMGLNPMATNKVLIEMHKYPGKLVPSDRLIEIFKQQYN
jgi:hypothetical protein